MRSHCLSCAALLLLVAAITEAAAYRALIRQGSQSGNKCPQSAPWPCRTGQCLPFAFICDGREDCADGYDEDKAMCIAKDRPPSIILEQFIARFHNWLIPSVLGQGSPSELAKLLTESVTTQDYAQALGMSQSARKHLARTLQFAKDGRVLDLIVEGMPEEAYREAYALFGQIVDSGFLGLDGAK